MSSTSKENGVRRGKFGGSILFAVEELCLNMFTIICLNINYYISFNLDLCLVILHSTSHQLIELHHKICIALENGQITVAIYCDISKAFDRLWHKGLIKSYWYIM
jgi:hypothetical protein